MVKDLEIQLSDLLGETVLGLQPTSGGDISQAFLILLQNKKLFCKLNYGQNAYAMFSSERAGLKLISDSGTIKTPEVISCSNLEKGACLIMEYIEPRQPTAIDMQKFGHQLANLHLCSGAKYGLETDNFIGSLPQSNTRHSHWTSFYVRERLQPQLQRALENNLLSKLEVPQIQIIESAVEKCVSGISPGLLHGDLWQGNYLISSNGEPYLIDPAVFYGHCEVDIAMTKLFGSFGSDFYAAYHEIIPISDGHHRREGLYQLYYLLVHLNLFGRSYYQSVLSKLNYYF